MKEYITTVWNYRHFWLALVGMDLRTRYRRSVLGIGWSLLHPVCMTAVLCIVFQHVFGQNNLRLYAPMLLAGLAFWNYFLAVTVHSCLCLYHGEAYIRQCPTPLAIYPLRTAIGGGVHFIMALGVVIVASWLFNGFGNLASLVTLIPTLLIMLIFGWSMATIMGFANVYFNDTQHIAEVVCQILFYATPIIYTADFAGQKMNWLMKANPLAAFVALIRKPILEGVVPDGYAFATAGLTTMVAFAIAILTLKKCQERLIFRL